MLVGGYRNAYLLSIENFPEDRQKHLPVSTLELKSEALCSQTKYWGCFLHDWSSFQFLAM